MLGSLVCIETVAERVPTEVGWNCTVVEMQFMGGTVVGAEPASEKSVDGTIEIIDTESGRLSGLQNSKFMVSGGWPKLAVGNTVPVLVDGIVSPFGTDTRPPDGF